VVTVSLLFRYAPRRRQPGLSWLMVGAGLATALWWLISLLLAAFVTQSSDFGATYGSLTGVMALLLWANLTGIALFLGIAFTAQLEARRARGSGPALPSSSSCLRTGPTPHPPSARSPKRLPGCRRPSSSHCPTPALGQRFQMAGRWFPSLGRVPRMARTPRGGRENPGGPGSRPVQAADRSGGARGLDAPVAFYDGDGRPG